MAISKINNPNYHRLINKKIKLLYKYFLENLSTELNNIHSENFKIYEWEILIGHWLKIFTKKILGHYYSKNQNIRNNLKFENINITNQSYDFNSICSEIFWNQQFNFFVNQIKKKKKLKIKKINNFAFETKEKNFISGLKESTKKVYFYLFKPIFKKYKIIIYNSYLGKYRDILLQLKYGYIPLINLPKNFKYNTASKKLRDSILKNKNSKKNFYKLYQLLIYNMPTNFLENYKNMKNFVSKNYPSKTKLIFNSSESITDDTFKMWILLQKKKNKTKLLILEHGLNYGIVNDNYPQTPRIELKYTDYIFTWGKSNIPRSIPMFTSSDKFFKMEKKEKLVLIFNQSIPDIHYISNKECFDNYFNIKKFYNNLDNKLKKKLMIRLHKTNFKPYSKKKILKKIKLETKNSKLSINDGFEKMNKLVKLSRILVFTYPSTGFLEAIRSNVPCLMLWKNFDLEIDISAKKNFETLRRDEIIFTSEKKLSKKVNKIWNKIDLWWYEKNIQKNLRKFKNKYCNGKINLNKICREINKIA